MLSPFVFSHAVYSSRPLLRIALVSLPLVISLIIIVPNRPLRVISSGERALIALLALNLLWEFASCFWAISYSVGIRELGAGLSLLSMVIALSLLRRSVSVSYFKKSLVGAISVVLILVLLHTFYDLWLFKQDTLEKYNLSFNRYSLYALKTCFYHKNIVSAFVLFTVVTVYTSSLHFSRKGKLWVALIIGIGLALLLLFQSRSAQVALLVFIASTILIMIAQSNRATLYRLIGPVMLFSILTILIARTGRLRYSSWNSRSSQERLQLWENTVELIKEKPLLGHGIGNWPMVFPKTGLKDFVRIQERGRNFFMQPHNDYLKVWSETGLLGLMLFLSVPLYLLYLCIKRRKERESIYFFALLTFFIVIIVTGRKGELSVYAVLAGMLVEAFASTSEKTNNEVNSSWGLPKTLLLILLPLSCYSIYASILEQKQVNNLPILHKISKRMDYDAFSKNLSEKFNPLASTTRMTQPLKSRYAFFAGKLGYQEQALELYEEAFLDSPFHLATKFRAARLYIHCKQEERATELLKEILLYNPDHKPSLELLKKLEE